MAKVLQKEAKKDAEKRDPKVQIPWSKCMPMEEALSRAEKAGKVIASHRLLTQAFIGKCEWLDFEYPRSTQDAFWTGTMTGYDKPGKLLGKAIEYVDPKTGITYVFPVPPKLRGKKDILLVVEHPDFKLITKGNSRIVQAAHVGVVENFPDRDGFYYPDPKYRMPQGEYTYVDVSGAVFLDRIETRVALISRRNVDVGDSWTYYGVGVLSSEPSAAYNVVLESAARR